LLLPADWETFPLGTQPSFRGFFLALELVRSCTMEWQKPEVIEKEVGLEVTTYSPAELDHD
jgi:coenzyme PQQ precursor peptide PqqA